MDENYFYTVRRLDGSITMRVKISSEFRVRVWIALRLIKLAVIILGARFEYEGCEEEK